MKFMKFNLPDSQLRRSVLFVVGLSVALLITLAGKDRLLMPPWRVAGRGSAWWKIRTHVNHFELIRSCFVKAER